MGARRAGVYFPGLTNVRGGAERHVVLLARELDRHGWDTLLITDVDVSRQDLESDLGRDLGAVRVHTLEQPAQRALGLLAVDEARHLATQVHQLRELHLDLFIQGRFRSTLPGSGAHNVIYCHFPYPQSPPVQGLARRAYTAAVNGSRQLLLDRNRGGFLATYDEIWANSEFTGRHVSSAWGRQPSLLYPACDMIERLPKKRVIAAVGRMQRPGELIPYKAQDVLIRAFAELTDLHAQGWELVLIGGTTPADQEFVAGLRRAAEGLPITLITDGSRRQVEETLGAASIFWHAQGFGTDAGRYPHLQEHFGISTVEAMSAGAIPLVHGGAGPEEIVRGAQITQLPTWTDVVELQEATRFWAGLDQHTLEAVRSACQAHARRFDLAHFSTRLGELL